MSSQSGKEWYACLPKSNHQLSGDLYPKSYGQQNVTLGHSMRWIFELLTPLVNDWGYELAKARL
jgi:hypothetical protein